MIWFRFRVVSNLRQWRHWSGGMRRIPKCIHSVCGWVMWGTALRSRICWRYSRGSVRWIVLSRIRRGALHSCTSGGARMLERRERLFRVWSFLGLRWKSSLRDRFVLTFNCLLFVMWFIDFGYMLTTLMWCGAFVWLVWWLGLSLFSGEVDGFLVGVGLRILSLQ